MNQFDLLTDEEKQQLTILLAEADNRGLEIPSLGAYGPANWRVDDNGYFTKLDSTFYNPNIVQSGFINSNAVFCGFWGSRGGGKSSSGSQKALRKIKAGQNGIIANPDFENLKISTWPEFREWVPWNMVVPAHRRMRNPEWQPHQPFVLAFTNGVRVIVKGIKDHHSARGPNVNWFWFDEAQRTDDDLAWQTAIASVRVGKDPQSWATFTTNGVDHWTTKLFINHEIPEDALEILKKVGTDRPMVEDFHGNLHDNMDNLDPIFVAQIMAAYPAGWLRDQEVFGKVVKREGALGDPTWFDNKILPAVPDSAIIKNRVRYWDLAASEKKVGARGAINDPDETVGTKLSWDKSSDLFYLEDQVCGTWEWLDIKEQIYQTALQDGPYVKIYVEQEPAAGGKNQVAELKNYLREKLPLGWPEVQGHLPKESGDKVMRANTWFSEASAGKIFLIAGLWVEGFLGQVGCFNYCRHDDKIDSMSGARHVCAPIKKWVKMDFLYV